MADSHFVLIFLSICIYLIVKLWPQEKVVSKSRFWFINCKPLVQKSIFEYLCTLRQYKHFLRKKRGHEWRSLRSPGLEDYETRRRKDRLGNTFPSLNKDLKIVYILLFRKMLTRFPEILQISEEGWGFPQGCADDITFHSECYSRIGTQASWSSTLCSMLQRTLMAPFIGCYSTRQSLYFHYWFPVVHCECLWHMTPLVLRLLEFYLVVKNFLQPCKQWTIILLIVFWNVIMQNAPGWVV